LLFPSTSVPANIHGAIQPSESKWKHEFAVVDND
jgi:hypothetical protein